MATEPRLTSNVLKVLGALVSEGELSGSEIAKSTSLASGTLYPLLLRLEDAGWLDSRWEAGEPSDLGRPRRRYYRVTGKGQKAISDVVRNLVPAMGKLTWA